MIYVLADTPVQCGLTGRTPKNKDHARDAEGLGIGKGLKDDYPGDEWKCLEDFLSGTSWSLQENRRFLEEIIQNGADVLVVLREREKRLQNVYNGKVHGTLFAEIDVLYSAGYLMKKIMVKYGVECIIMMRIYDRNPSWTLWDTHLKDSNTKKTIASRTRERLAAVSA